MKKLKGRQPMTTLRIAALAGCVFVLPTCSSPSTPTLAETARVLVEGTAPNPLRLIISTDFVEVFDNVNQEFIVGLNVADTTFVDLPLDRTLTVPAPGDVLVRLTQLETTPASVRMQVHINGSPLYDQSATLSDVGTLEYRFFSNR